MAIFPILTSDGDTIVSSDGHALAAPGIDLSNQLFTPSDQFDESPRDAAVLIPATGALVTTFPFAVAFTGDILSSGVFALALYDTGLGAFSGVALYNHLLTLIATIDATTLTGLNTTVFNFVAVSAWEPDQFYVAWCGDTTTGITKVTTISATGVMGATVWTLPNTVAGNPMNLPPQCTAMGVSIDGRYLYYSDGILNGTLIQAIHRYDLLASVAATDLVSTGSHSTYFGQISLVQANEDVIVLLYGGGSNFAGKRYNASGVLQQTYTLVANAAAFDDPIIERDANALFFWVHTFEDATGNTASYTKFLISDGSTPVSWTVNSRNSGLSNIPLSCPFFVFGSLTPPGPPVGVTFPTRRLRRFMLPWSNNFEMFISRLEIQMQTGVGLITGQGSDPTIMLRFSKDGGMTWGPEIQMSAGKLGEYLHRVYVNRLPRARQPVVEITTSDPVLWGFLACLVDIEQGTN